MLSLLGPSTANADDVHWEQPTRIDSQKTDVSLIRGISVALKASAGSGCPDDDSARVTPGRDGSSFSVTFKDLVARGGESVNCHLVLDAHVSNNMTFTISKITNVGDVGLSGGAAGQHTFESYFGGESHTMTLQHDFDGPYNQGWDALDVIKQDQLNWAPCGGSNLLIIKNYIQVIGSSADDVRLTSSFVQLRLRAC